MAQVPNYDQLIQAVAPPPPLAVERPVTVRETPINVGQLNINTAGTQMLYEAITDTVSSGVKMFETIMEVNFAEKKWDYEKVLEERKRKDKVTFDQFMQGLIAPTNQGLTGHDGDKAPWRNGVLGNWGADLNL